MQGQAVKPGTGVTPKPSQSVAVSNSKPALQASQFMPGPRLVYSQAPSYSSGQSTTSTPVVAPTYTLQGQAASVKPASPSLPVSKSSPVQYLDRAQASGLSTNVVTFPNLEAYPHYFLNLLELERLEIAASFDAQFESSTLSLGSQCRKGFLYSLELLPIVNSDLFEEDPFAPPPDLLENLSFGDQLCLYYENHEEEIVHIYDLIEGENIVQFIGEYTDGVRVEYYRSLPMRRMMEAVEKLNDEHPLLDLILGDAREENKDWKAREYVPKVGIKLDDSQKEAIFSALNSQLTLILGPPGSGKTSVAAELVVQLCRKGGKVLVCAPSNVAADNLALRLKEKQVRVLRFYSKGAEKKTNIADKFAFHSYVLSLACLYFPQYATQLLCSPTFSRNDVKEIIGKEEELVLEREVLDTFQVVCSTCVSSADAILANFTFDSLLIDEAAFCCEPESLIPIVVSKCKKLVLIGDPEQLRPIIKSSKAKKLGLEISLFERLQRAGINIQWLEVQYRMHPDISYYPRNCFYGGRLRDGITAEDRSMAGRKVASLFQGKPLLFVHIEGKEDYYNNTTSRWNRKEAETTISVLERLRTLDVPLSSIGLVTPYEGQRLTLVKRVFERLNLTETDIEIKNVDGYQGREKDFIVMSCVRSNARNIGFLANPNRINVALTRAKYGLVIVGNSKTLRIDKIWAGFVTCVEERGRIISAAELERQPVTG